jgi:TATA-binding protein-associated factor
MPSNSVTIGGAIQPKEDVETEAPESLTLSPNQTPWTVVLDALDPNLLDPVWQVRHGAALSVMELLRHVGNDISPAFLLDLARDLLTLLALDRFGDFVGDSVIAPVRETAAQALGVLLKYLPNDAVAEVHATLMSMVKQSWAVRGKDAKDVGRGEKFSWEVRHAGLLGLKYEVAVRQDLLGVAEPVAINGHKTEDAEDIKPDVQAVSNGDTTNGAETSYLRDVVEAAVLA